jgi:cyclophilin family peptidyl-prolyl cis-trans isomerase
MKRYLTLLALAMFPILASCETKEETEKAAAAAPGETAAPAAPKEGPPKVRLKTSMGDIVLELNAEKAPISVENFLGYVKKSYYDNTVFHRVMPNFMIQGGGFTVTNGQMTQKSADRPIKNEGQNGLKNLRGTIAMARTAALDSATSQFFINVVDNAGLDYPNNGGYAVFGKVVEGLDVVDKIKAGKTVADPRGEPSVPVEPVVIKSATIE